MKLELIRHSLESKLEVVGPRADGDCPQCKRTDMKHRNTEFLGHEGPLVFVYECKCGNQEYIKIDPGFVSAPHYKHWPDFWRGNAE